MQVVINVCYGGFSISIEAMKELIKRRAKCIERITVTDYCGKDSKKEFLACLKDAGDGYKSVGYGGAVYKRGIVYCIYGDHAIRSDKDLVAVVKKLKKKADGPCAELKIVEIPDGISWSISEYDGSEHIEEEHRTWR